MSSLSRVTAHPSSTGDWHCVMREGPDLRSISFTLPKLDAHLRPANASQEPLMSPRQIWTLKYTKPKHFVVLDINLYWIWNQNTEK